MAISIKKPIIEKNKNAFSVGPRTQSDSTLGTAAIDTHTGNKKILKEEIIKNNFLSQNKKFFETNY